MVARNRGAVFYLLAPFFARVFLLDRIRRRAVLVGAIAVLSAINAFAVSGDDNRYTTALPYFLHFFLVGFLLAEVYMCEWREAPTTGGRWDVLGIAAWAALVPVAWNPVTSAFLLAPLVFVAYVGPFRGRILNAVARSPWLVTIGGMCYTSYLDHPLVISSAGRVTLPLGPSNGYIPAVAVHSAILAGLTLVVSSVLFAALEKPFMRRDWHVRLAARLRGRAEGRH